MQTCCLQCLKGVQKEFKRDVDSRLLLSLLQSSPSGLWLQGKGLGSIGLAMAHFSDDPASNAVLQKIRAVFDTVRSLLISWLNINDSFTSPGFLLQYVPMIGLLQPKTQVIETQNFGEYVNNYLSEHPLSQAMLEYHPVLVWFLPFYHPVKSHPGHASGDRKHLGEAPGATDASGEAAACFGERSNQHHA